jgi:hypothetical protein
LPVVFRETLFNLFVAFQGMDGPNLEERASNVRISFILSIIALTFGLVVSVIVVILVVILVVVSGGV